MPSVRITNNCKLIETTCTIHVETLYVFDSAKYLGLSTDSNFNFNIHANITVKKENTTQAFLGRNV